MDHADVADHDAITQNGCALARMQGTVLGALEGEGSPFGSQIQYRFQVTLQIEEVDGTGLDIPVLVPWLPVMMPASMGS